MKCCHDVYWDRNLSRPAETCENYILRNSQIVIRWLVICRDWDPSAKRWRQLRCKPFTEKYRAKNCFQRGKRPGWRGRLSIGVGYVRFYCKSFYSILVQIFVNVTSVNVVLKDHSKQHFFGLSYKTLDYVLTHHWDSQ